MAITTGAVWHCDRCGVAVEVEYEAGDIVGDEMPTEWHAVHVDGDSQTMDICGQCFPVLLTWFAELPANRPSVHR